MDAEVLARILSDPAVVDYTKIKHKYSVDLQELVGIFRQGFYSKLPIYDFSGRSVVYLENVLRVRLSAIKSLLVKPAGYGPFSLKAMEEEIVGTLSIEDIDFARSSVRKILQGFAPADEAEDRIYAMKKGIDFIADQSNKISEQNLFRLYQIAISEQLHEDQKLLPGKLYRHDAVYIVGMEVEHTGLSHEKLPDYMSDLINFINTEDEINDLIKAAIVHFYLAYLHPYFDGNGRMARLLHLWYLIRQGYPSALYIPLSHFIEKSRRKYYSAFLLTEKNLAVADVLDLTSFLAYFVEHVYNQISLWLPGQESVQSWQSILSDGQITEKEKKLWAFVLSAYGLSEFTTKQLEREFGDAAYATIHGFVLKFTDLGLLSADKYSNKVKYKIRVS